MLLNVKVKNKQYYFAWPLLNVNVKKINIIILPGHFLIVEKRINDIAYF
jgi:hypothetical protein